jgi:NADPH:quinone reductase-like Zn-dependent oxidoreductase
MRASIFADFGGPDVLSWETVDDPRPGPEDVVVEILACGLNHCDLDSRAGVSRWSFELPWVLGGEFAGVVAETGAGVQGFAVGDPVAVLQHYARPDGSLVQFGIDCWGGYAEYAAVPAATLVPLGSRADVEVAAAAQTVASTAWRMVTTLGEVRAGETVLVPSASGGVGSALVRAAARRGARIVATVGSAEKAAAVRALGADVVAVHDEVPVRDLVAEATGGVGVDCVLDTVGGPLLADHLGCLRLDGRYVICGAHAGEVVPLDLVALFQRGHRLIGFGFCTEDELRTAISLALDGDLRVPVAAGYPIARAADAHRALDRREHVGKLLLRGGED